MRRQKYRAVHPRGMFERIIDAVRGREQMLVRGAEDHPLLLLSYPRGKSEIALSLESIYTRTLPSLPAEIMEPYLAALRALPAIVVVLLRPTNVCGCLGHHHPAGTESRLTRRLGADLGSPTGEIDLAYESIRRWSPQPLSSMAAEIEERYIADIHYEAAMLTVLLHELEHLAFPEHTEREVRLTSNAFYSVVMDELLSRDWGVSYSVRVRPRP